MNPDDLVAQAECARRDGDTIRARDLLRDAISHYRSSNASVALAYALRALGEVERGIDESDGGVAAYEESVAILRGEKLPLKLAHTVRHLADIYRHLGEKDRAERCYDEALAIYRSHPETAPLDLANALRGVAILKCDESHWAEAKRIYDAHGIDTSRERKLGE